MRPHSTLRLSTLKADLATFPSPSPSPSTSQPTSTPAAGVETIAHLKENRRITIMFCALEGAARIVRLFGTGTVHEFGTPEYEQLIPAEKRLSGSRAAIVVDVHKVGSVRTSPSPSPSPSPFVPSPSLRSLFESVACPHLHLITLIFILVLVLWRQSCGYAVPLYTFQAHRTALFNWSEKMEARDVTASPLPASTSSPPFEEHVYPERSMKWWWVHWNLRSLDGLPGLAHAHIADAVPRTGAEAHERQRGVHEPPSDGSVVILGNRVPRAGVWERLVWVLARKGEAVRLLKAFSLGVVVAAVCIMVAGGREACSSRWPAGVLP